MQTPVATADLPRPVPNLVVAAHRIGVLRYYTQEQQDAVRKLYSVAKSCRDTGGGSRIVKFLLSLYNGNRFKFDLTDFRCFDQDNLDAALLVLRMDAERTYCEIHVLLNAVLGGDANVGAELEHWAYQAGVPGACKKHQLPDLRRVAS